MNTSAPIRCEIRSARRAAAADLSAILHVCAQDLAIPVQTTVQHGGISPGKHLLTLHLPAALAAQQTKIWCLACRLACFCPRTRVSILIQAEPAFAPASQRRTA